MTSTFSIQESRASGRFNDAMVGDLVSAMDSPDFPHVALRSLYRLVPSDGAAVFVYSGDDLVYVAANELAQLVESRAVPNYRQGTFRYNPFFQHHRSGGLASGVYAMSHLARAPHIRRPADRTTLVQFDPVEEMGFRTQGWPAHLAEIVLAIRLSPTQTAQVALYRYGKAGFDRSDVSTLSSVNITVGALFTRFWQHMELDAGGADQRIAAALQFIAKGKLSVRELETLRLGIAGYDVREIADRMAVSDETVKTHRKRAYAKIGARSQHDIMLAVLKLTMAN